MAKVKRRLGKNQLKALVANARDASGNSRYGLHRMPKGHWMRTDAAKQTWQRKKNYRHGGDYRKGIV